MGDSELAEVILNDLNAFKKCAMCSIGLDEKNRCKNPEVDCLVGIFEWLGREETNSKEENHNHKK